MTPSRNTRNYILSDRTVIYKPLTYLDHRGITELSKVSMVLSGKANWRLEKSQSGRGSNKNGQKYFWIGPVGMIHDKRLVETGHLVNALHHNGKKNNSISIFKKENF